MIGLEATNEKSSRTREFGNLLKRTLMSFICLMVLSATSFAQTSLDFQSINLKCFSMMEETPKEWIINTESEYARLKKYMHKMKDCNKYNLPEIDFKSKTLLGFRIDTFGCSEPQLISEVTRDQAVIKYKVKISIDNACRRGFSSIQWVLMDKVAKEETVQFEKMFNE